MSWTSLKLRMLGWAAGHLLPGLRKPRVTTRDLQKKDYTFSTQRLGIRFISRIRDVFRFRWLKPR